MTPIHSDEVLPPVKHSTNIEKISEIVPKNDLICENSTNVIPNNSQINIENSSDVIIGPVTQYHGPITIYQHLNGNDHQRPSDANKELNDIKFETAKSVKTEEKPIKDSLEAKIKSVKLKTIVSISIVALLLLIIVGIGVTTTLKQEPPPPDKENNNNDKESPPKEQVDSFLGHHKLIYRSSWGGRAPLSVKRLRHPTRWAIISHTATGQCSDQASCSEKMQSFQSYHVSRGHPDIGYNFLIGGDGNIYVGRGWDVQNFHQDNSIGVSFIGNYVFDELSSEMIQAAQMLLKRGVELKKLDRNYKLIAHNQTFKTQSPGVNVYAVIEEWPHFSNESF